MASIGDDQRKATKMSVQRAARELASLREEIGRLEVQLGSKRDRAIKLEHYVEMAREFGDETTSTNESRRESDSERQRAPRGGMSGRAVQECIAILREHHQPMHTAELHKLLLDRGIRLGGKNPAQALSGYLSRTPGLIADRSRGWSLIEWESESKAETSGFEFSDEPPPQSARAAA
jgi:hypothetical protein